MKVVYHFDQQPIEVELDDLSKFSVGEEICLAQTFQDITLQQHWAKEGFCLLDASELFEFSKVKVAITDVVKNTLMQTICEEDLVNFSLEQYHHFVSEELH